MVNVGALDYGVHFEVHKSDIKPLVNDLSIVSVPYRVSSKMNPYHKNLTILIEYQEFLYRY